MLTLASSLFFFIVTNFAVWASGDMYERTWLGLRQCYVMALPFFRNTTLSDLFYTGLLFGIYGLACAVLPAVAGSPIEKAHQTIR